MAVNEWLTLGSSVGALTAALIALFTLIELSKQRKASYKPDLAVLENIFEIRNTGKRILSKSIPTDWTNKDDTRERRDASLQLVNVGFGAAKNVSAEWLYDIKHLVSEASQLIEDNNLELQIIDEGHLLSLRTNAGGIYVPKNSGSNFKYILPASQDDKEIHIPLPPSFTLAVSAYLAPFLKYKRTQDPEIPHLTLKLEYKDIGGGTHISIHKLKLDVQYAQIPAANSDESALFDLHITETM